MESFAYFLPKVALRAISPLRGSAFSAIIVLWGAYCISFKMHWFEAM